MIEISSELMNIDRSVSKRFINCWKYHLTAQNSWESHVGKNYW